MIDPKNLRENPKIYYESCKARGFDSAVLDRFFDLDMEWRNALKQLNNLKHEKNLLTSNIAKNVKEGLDSGIDRNEVKSLNNSIEELEKRIATLEAERDGVLKTIPNLLHPSVPICKGDENNQFVRFSGNAGVFQEDLDYFRNETRGTGESHILVARPESHVDMMARLGIADLERAGRSAGARFFYLKNRLVKLELALVNFAIDFLAERGFEILEPPFMLNFQAMDGATDLETFKDTLYKIEGEDLYLISTSEHPIAAYYMGEILDENKLPARFAGVSPCFRKEAGAHGKDTKGIFRVHQFTKIEQFIYCKPEHSWDFLEEILGNAEDIYKKLGIPYRVVNICSGELGNLAAKKYDIEAWFPAQGKFREVVSASNDTDYQARSLNIRYRTKEGNKFVHTLNSTAIATTRTIVAIMENFQEDGGFRIPSALIPYAGFDFVGPD
ncbi:MAG: serine--tRNA ligase [Thermoplasmataceae archaeon]